MEEREKIMLPYGPFRELRESDLAQKVKLDGPPNTEHLTTVFENGVIVGSVKLLDFGFRGGDKYAKIDTSIPDYVAVIKADRISTAEEYFEAGTNRADNRAGKNIDAGREPYLFNLELQSLDMHPFQSVWDCMVKKQGDSIGLELGGREPVYVTPDTLIVWRG
jgi:hypothetical protein